MKKLLSIILSIIMLISLIVIQTTSVSAKVVPNTYIAKDKTYSVSKGTVFTYGNGALYFKGNNKKVKQLTTYSSDALCQFYVRNDILYYNTNTSTTHKIMQIGINGKNKKVIYNAGDNSVVVIGGYGSSVIFQSENKVCKLKNGKVTTLLKTSERINYSATATVFNGKIYYDNKSYDIKTGKTKAFKGKKLYSTKNYLYYTNVNSNLKRIDKKGNRTIVAKNIYKLYYANNGATVIFSRLDKNNTEVFYKRSGLTTNAVKLADWNSIFNQLKNANGANVKSHYSVAVDFSVGKVYFNLVVYPDAKYNKQIKMWEATKSYTTLLYVTSNGGTTSIIKSLPEGDSISMVVVDKKLLYKTFTDENLDPDLTWS
jgi:hypothetical protein